MYNDSYIRSPVIRTRHFEWNHQFCLQNSAFWPKSSVLFAELVLWKETASPVYRTPRFRKNAGYKTLHQTHPCTKPTKCATHKQHTQRLKDIRDVSRRTHMTRFNKYISPHTGGLLYGFVFYDLVLRIVQPTISIPGSRWNLQNMAINSKPTQLLMVISTLVYRSVNRHNYWWWPPLSKLLSLFETPDSCISIDRRMVEIGSISSWGLTSLQNLFIFTNWFHDPDATEKLFIFYELTWHLICEPLLYSSS